MVYWTEDATRSPNVLVYICPKEKENPMAKKRSPKSESSQENVPKDVAASVSTRIQALLNELTDAELNILKYEIDNPQEPRSMEKLGRIASVRLKRKQTIKELSAMLIDYNIERHPRLESHYLTDKYHLREYFYDYCM